MVVLCDSERERPPPALHWPPNLITLCTSSLAVCCSHWDDATIYLDKLCNWLCYCFVALTAIIGQTARTDCKLHFGKAVSVAFPRITATGKFRVKAAIVTNIMWSTAVGAVLKPLSQFSSLGSQFSNNNYRKLTSFHQRQERSFPELPVS